MGLELDSEDSWNQAKRIAKLLLPVPNSFSRAVSLLWEEHRKNREGAVAQLSPEASLAIRNLTKSEVLRAPLYFAAQALAPGTMAGTNPEQEDHLPIVKALGPGMYAALLCLVYYHRRLKKLCNNALWEPLSNDTILQMELGYLLGKTVRELGEADGILVGGMPYLGVGAFVVANTDQYTRYRNRFKGKLDITDERERWRCDHAQVAALLLKHAGVPCDILSAAAALAPFEESDQQLSPELANWRAACAWLDELNEGRCPPKRGDYSQVFKVAESEMDSLKNRAAELSKSGTTFAWMLRSSRDLGAA